MLDQHIEKTGIYKIKEFHASCVLTHFIEFEKGDIYTGGFNDIIEFDAFRTAEKLVDSLDEDAKVDFIQMMVCRISPIEYGPIFDYLILNLKNFINDELGRGK